MKPAINITRIQDTTDREGYLRLDRNERQVPLPSWFRFKLKEAITSDTLTTYPDQRPTIAKLAKHLDVHPARLILTPGADGAIKSLLHAYVRPGMRVGITEPTYAMYSVYTRMFGGFPDYVHGDIIILANPNQPTGQFWDLGEVMGLCSVAEAMGRLVIIDETYHDFYPEITAIPLLNVFDNLAIIRSFSKGAGLAGLRIGYTVANPQIINAMEMVRGCHDVNSVALLAANLILDHPEIIADHVEEIRKGAALLERELPKVGLEPVLPVTTNFMLFRGDDIESTINKLKQNRILVKQVFDDTMRITLGDEEQMQKVVEALKGG